MKIFVNILVGFLWGMVICLACLVVYFLIGIIQAKPDVLVNEDKEYLYYKEYEIYNRDSCIYKYHKPIIYDGEIVNKYSHIQGIPGKGGHWVHRTYIKYGDKENVEFGVHFYSNHEIGDKVKIKIEFYPYEKLSILNNE
jgi:hypothetical protein